MLGFELVLLNFELVLKLVLLDFELVLKLDDDDEEDELLKRRTRSYVAATTCRGTGHVLSERREGPPQVHLGIRSPHLGRAGLLCGGASGATSDARNCVFAVAVASPSSRAPRGREDEEEAEEGGRRRKEEEEEDEAGGRGGRGGGDGEEEDDEEEEEAEQEEEEDQ